MAFRLVRDGQVGELQSALDDDCIRPVLEVVGGVGTLPAAEVEVVGTAAAPQGVIAVPAMKRVVAALVDGFRLSLIVVTVSDTHSTGVV